MQCSVVQQGEVIIAEGSIGDEMYILFDGEAKAFVPDPDGQEQMVQHYTQPGEYFGELSLLYSSTRRATVRAASSRTHLLVIERQSFEKALGPFKELLLKNAAFRPAAQVMERARQQQDGPAAQLLGISGDERQLALSSFLYLAIGTAFYTKTGFEDFEVTSPIAGFYYAVQAGLAVGFGKLNPRSELAPYFTSAYVVAGAALLANFLSTVVADSLGDQSDKNLTITGKQASLRTLGVTALPLVLWWLVGLAFGHLHEHWDWGSSLLFAISCTSSVGLQGLQSSDDISLAFCAIYCLVGVPLYTLVLGRFTVLIAENILKRRQDEIRVRAMAAIQNASDEALSDVFAMADLNQCGKLSGSELVGLLRQLVGTYVTDEDVQFLVEQFDQNGDAALSKQEFIDGIRRWEGEEV